MIEASGSDDAELALGGRTPHVLLFPSSGAVHAVASYLERLRARDAKPIVATMGSATEAARTAGFPPDVEAPDASVADFVQRVTHHVIGRNGA